MPRLRFLRPSAGLGLEKRGIHPPIWPFIGRFYYLRLFVWLLFALISASLKLFGSTGTARGLFLNIKRASFRCTGKRPKVSAQESSPLGEQEMEIVNLFSTPSNLKVAVPEAVLPDPLAVPLT